MTPEQERLLIATARGLLEHLDGKNGGHDNWATMGRIAGEIKIALAPFSPPVVRDGRHT